MRVSCRRPLNTAAAMRVLMVGVLGVAVLRLSERLGPGEDADLLAADVVDVVLAGPARRRRAAIIGHRRLSNEAEPIADAQAS